MSEPGARRASSRQLRLFALVWFPLLLGVAGLILWRRVGWPGAALALWAVALGVGLAGGIRPHVVRPLFFGLMGLTRPIGVIVSRAVLALVYLLLFTPLGLLMRALGHDPMRRRFERGALSYWLPHEDSDDVARYFRQS